eukprot:TRINITY_DN16201_c0_g1_i2.p1 TRINITY_DN16201_c0_g1~~TRINITY_DN16201_c0_g1_i2.p1  ORF type:complete len:364 (+),score=70.87 TRINITY_DN16201_c0_g1_i2:35-1126(+)
MDSARKPLISPELPSKTLSRSSSCVAGRQVEVWNDSLFQRLRKLHGVSEEFLNHKVTQEEAVNFKAPRAETKNGKGGQAQFDSSCGRFVVKLLSSDDHKTLLEMARPLVERMLSGPSLLCPIYMHFTDPEADRHYIAMRNLTQVGPFSVKYDLKGCADDKTLEVNDKLITPVRKRWFSPHMWCQCAWNADRWQYYEGKVRARALRLGLAPAQRDEVVRLIASDAEWLVGQGVMDYSLLLAVRRLPPDVAKACGAGEPLPMAEAASTDLAGVRRWAMLDTRTGHLVVITCGIIDFLQPWTPAKKVAECIKILESNKATVPPPSYGQRFARHFEERLEQDDALKAQSNVVAEAAEDWCLKNAAQR